MTGKARLTLELSAKLNAEIERMAKERGESKVDILRDALALMITAQEATKEGFKVGAWKTNSSGQYEHQRFVGIKT